MADTEELFRKYVGRKKQFEELITYHPFPTSHKDRTSKQSSVVHKAVGSPLPVFQVFGRLPCVYLVNIGPITANRPKLDMMYIGRGSGQVQAPDYSAPASRPACGGELIFLSLSH